MDIAILEKEALSELSEGFSYYEKEAPGLGIEFINEVKSAITRILRYSSAWSKSWKKNVQRFIPISIIASIKIVK